MDQKENKTYSFDDKVQIVIESYILGSSLAEYCEGKSFNYESVRKWRSSLIKDCSHLISRENLILIFEARLKKALQHNTLLRIKLSSIRGKNRQLSKSRNRHIDLEKNLLSEATRFRAFNQNEQIDTTIKRTYSAEEKTKIVALIAKSQLPLIAVHKLFGIPRCTFRGWQSALDKGGEASLVRKIGINRPSHRLPIHILEAALCLASQYPYIRPMFAAEILSHSFGKSISGSSVARLLSRHGLSGEKIKLGITGGFQKIIHGASVNHVWLSDFSELPSYGGIKPYFLSVMDDYSRYIISWKITTSQKGEDIIMVLSEALKSAKSYLKNPVLFNVDNGAGYRSKVLSEYCEQNGVEKIHANPYNWSGRIRIETFHGILKKAMRKVNPKTDLELMIFLKEYVDYYNEQKPHSAFAGAAPGGVYRGETMISAHERELLKARSMDYRVSYNRDKRD